MRDGRTWVKHWLSENLKNDPLAINEDHWEGIISGLEAKLLSDAKAAGMSRKQIEDACGDDPREFLEREFTAIFDPDAGGIND